ncbi:hypothetical protein HWV62_44534 [Athelia sp. TMB]|nr:hypothetical protein HWV62_44534 [Athelia sp. TMB]
METEQQSQARTTYSSLTEYIRSNEPIHLPYPLAPALETEPPGSDNHAPISGNYDDQDQSVGWKRESDIIKQGLVPMKGRFTEEENSAILGAMFQYQADNKLSEDDMDAIVMGGAKRKHTNFWREINAAVPARPTPSVYAAVRRVHAAMETGHWEYREHKLLEE